MPFRFCPHSLADRFLSRYPLCLSPRLSTPISPFLLLALSVTLPLAASAADEEKRPEQKRGEQTPEMSAEKIQSVEVSAPGAANQRRNDTAARIVVNRDEFLSFGDTAVADVLKRLPGVSVVGSDIRMRGLGAGYTQIMVNGEPVPSGFSIDSLSPDLIERIEILRTTTAEFSTQAIAGSINIVLRKGVFRASRQIKLSATHADGATTPGVSLELADKDAGFSYSLNANLNQSRNRSEPVTTETLRDAAGNVTDLRQFHEHIEFKTNKISLAPRLNWTMAEGDQLTSQSLLEFSQSTMAGRNAETTLSGSSSTYPRNDYRSSADISGIRSDLSWSHRFSPDARLDSKLGLNYNKRVSDYYFDGYSTTVNSPFVRNVVSDAIDQSLTASGKYLWRLNDEHSLAFGWDGGLIRRSEQRLQYDHNAPDSLPGSIAFLDENYRADVRRLALFVQDEWDISAQWQTYLGLRWEGLHTAIQGRTIADTNTSSSVLSPVVQVVWKLPGTEKDQLRFALSRTYKAPTTRNLVPRRYTVNNDNNPNNSDFQGNPHLLPELAWGLDTAYEHYFSAQAMFSISAFLRRIQHVTTYTLFQQDGVWITTPDNRGSAQVYGLEMDSRFPLSLWFPQAPAIDLRINAARNWSRLDSVPGPDNRLNSQVPLTANLGLDYRRSDTHQLGMNFNLQTAGRVQDSAALSTYKNVTRNLDWYSLWKLRKGTQIRLSVSNVLHQPAISGQTYLDPTTHDNMQRTSQTPVQTTLKLMWEQEL
ncbi:TonB-dependent receptor plug domain-containing protein [Undibacterium sp. SXout7W]|uniref:TonB-dependent receptor plug domain-containing protein n=1 Tax=Undibacterium sp. SXout7W TaxID=3413049 RepID=UPI003BF5A608